MPDLNFAVEGAEAVPYAASPLIAFKLRVTAPDETLEIHSIILRCQIMIDATRRHYTPRDQANLNDIFGEPERWGQTLRTMLWTHANVVVPPFQGTIAIDLSVPCTFDFNVASTKYFHGLESGEIPLTFLFSGSLFYATEEHAMQVAQISWEKESQWKLPLEVWKNMMDLYYPNTAWLCLRRDMFERLYQFKVKHGIPTWEAALEMILPVEGEGLPQ